MSHKGCLYLKTDLLIFLASSAVQPRAGVSSSQVLASLPAWAGLGCPSSRAACELAILDLLLLILLFAFGGCVLPAPEGSGQDQALGWAHQGAV